MFKFRKRSSSDIAGRCLTYVSKLSTDATEGESIAAGDMKLMLGNCDMGNVPCASCCCVCWVCCWGMDCTWCNLLAVIMHKLVKWLLLLHRLVKVLLLCRDW